MQSITRLTTACTADSVECTEHKLRITHVGSVSLPEQGGSGQQSTTIAATVDDDATSLPQASQSPGHNRKPLATVRACVASAAMSAMRQAPQLPLQSSI
jgi:hypothetical protein